MRESLRRPWACIVAERERTSHAPSFGSCAAIGPYSHTHPVCAPNARDRRAVAESYQGEVIIRDLRPEGGKLNIMHSPAKVVAQQHSELADLRLQSATSRQLKFVCPFFHGHTWSFGRPNTAGELGACLTVPAMSTGTTKEPPEASSTLVMRICPAATLGWNQDSECTQDIECRS